MKGLWESTLGVYTLGICSLAQPILDLRSHTLGVYSGSLLWESILWESTLLGNRFRIWPPTLWESTLGVYTLEVYSLGQAILDLAPHTLGVYSGSLQSWATDFGSAKPHSGSLLWESTLGVSTLGVYTLGQPILDLPGHMPVLKKITP